MKEENQDALRSFNEEWDNAHTTTTPTHPQDPKGGNAIQGNTEIGLADQVAAAKASLNPGGVYQPAHIPTTGDGCPQCGTMHPPVRPGEVCPVAVGMGKVNKDGQPITPAASHAPPTQPVQPEVSETPEVVEKPVAKPLSEDNRPDKIPPQQPQPVTPPTQTIGKAEPEPAPLAENNIPTEVHVNKYLHHWGEVIEAHCKTHGIVNVKRLMRHLTVEVTDFLEHNKGR